jgi:putative methionine-R-sulfoxide reductase with GAF domain
MGNIPLCFKMVMPVIADNDLVGAFDIGKPVFEHFIPAAFLMS